MDFVAGGKGLRIISINSMHFSKNNKPGNSPGSTDLIIRWVEEQLVEVQKRNMRAVLVYHLPLGTYVTPHGIEQFWDPKYESKFRLLLQQYKACISFSFTGHAHISFLGAGTAFASDLVVSILKESEQATSMADNNYNNFIISRSVSPLSMNIPGFAIFHYSGTLDAPKYYEEYTFLLEKSYNATSNPGQFWKYLFHSQRDLQMDDLSPKGIIDFLTSLSNDLNKFLKYAMYKLGNPSGTSSEYLPEIVDKICEQYRNEPPAQRMCVDSLNAHYYANTDSK